MAEQEYFVYGSVLRALSFGLYPDRKFVIREFIQNAFDAVSAWNEETDSASTGPIEIKADRPCIYIADHGIGMDKREAEKFRYLGYSEKDRKKDVGFRGIGKDSGLAVAEEIIVTTSKYGNPEKFTIIIEAGEMIKETPLGENPPLEELLREHTSVVPATESPEEHYTFVELRNIREDAGVLFEEEEVKDFIRRVAPLPFDTDFGYSDEITSRLGLEVPGFSHVDITFNGEYLYKLFPRDYARPEFYPVLITNSEGENTLIAFCWYCPHRGKGQFGDKEKSGLIYRHKNFAVGDRQLTRSTLWRSTPERAFYFFGEIHVIDEGVVPSSDRTDFEDNEGRERLYAACSDGIVSVLNHVAEIRNSQRLFKEKIKAAEGLLSTTQEELESHEIPIEIKKEKEYGIRKFREDIEKRVGRFDSMSKKTGKDRQLIRGGNKIIKGFDDLLLGLDNTSNYKNLGKELGLSGDAELVIRAILEVLKREFSGKPDYLEHLIKSINDAIEQVFGVKSRADG